MRLYRLSTTAHPTIAGFVAMSLKLKKKRAFPDAILVDLLEVSKGGRGEYLYTPMLEPNYRVVIFFQLTIFYTSQPLGR